MSSLEARSGPLCSPAPELPANFADRLLELEMEIDGNCCLTLVNELMELYQQAIEYYENKGSTRYVDLQTRMHRTLMRPEVLLVLKSALPRPVSQMPAIPSTLSISQTQELIRKKKPDFASPRSLPPVSAPIQVSRSLNQMFETHENSTKSAAKQVQNDVIRQGEVLQSRLTQRISSRKSSKINTPTLDHPSQQVDFEAVSLKLSSLPIESPPKIIRKHSTSMQISPAHTPFPEFDRMQNFDDLEKKLEEVMERSYTEKQEKLEEIKGKYEKEMKEMQGNGTVTGLIRQVLMQTKVEMEQEMTKAANLIDEKRRKEVKKVRLRYISRATEA